MGDLLLLGGTPLSLWASALLVVVASALVAVSARWIVESAVRLVRDMRVSATLVGLSPWVRDFTGRSSEGALRDQPGEHHR